MTPKTAMKPGDIINRLGDALPLIRQICDISGVPGASIGVFHEDQKIYTTHIGHRDVAAKLPPTSDTMYGIGSLTKGFVAASLAQLIGKHPGVTWTSPIQDILSEYQP
ncbi:Beta-lactamase/transpeptidase-like protein [Metarhizium guizhouense ARSEF 977]|uniref:Beta-lactamase/transpeptidase-like protein n=1 Tax=Metarhizium guizhouense (strain ARSEF 977) TaxID=1276136 RepID=A0A0B4HPG6_METGA|nr:Beta-lactamase/transpeptidase-like protein [Metarhizium guizhouense ARSEF 977]